MSFNYDACVQYFHTEDPAFSLSQLNLKALPQHLAVIMDGNGRWAQTRGLSRSVGHHEGIKALRELITASVRLGIPYVTAYAFSTENWSRPQEEVELLMALFAEEVHHEMPLLQKEGVRLRFIGDIDALPSDTRDSFYEGLRQTEKNTELELSLAVNYGSRAEMVRAAQKLAEACLNHEMKPADIDEKALASYMYTAGLPDPDLLIRTSGELRLSNYLLWQLAYTELYCSEVLWPDFNRFDLMKALQAYQSRSRRFGGIQ